MTLTDGTTVSGDYLVLAAGAQPNFFHTKGASEFAFPLYSLTDARHVRERVLQLFANANAKPELVDDGALTFVVVGGGPTGVEISGALSDLVHDVMPHRYPNLAVAGARIILVDLGHTLLAPFTDESHAYAAKQLQRRGVELRLAPQSRRSRGDHVSSGMAAPSGPTSSSGVAARWPRRSPATPASARAEAGASTYAPT